MKINSREWQNVNVKNYFEIDGYDPYEDPDLTYQEYMFINNVRTSANHEIVETDDFYECKEEWKQYCLAHYFQPIVIDKPWDQVSVSKKDAPKNVIYDEKGWQIPWTERSPYKEWHEKELKEWEEERKRHDREIEERKAKQNAYQRQRRERIKAEKLSKKQTSQNDREK